MAYKDKTPPHIKLDERSHVEKPMEQDHPTPTGEFLLYQTEDGQTRVECRFEEETLWLTQALMTVLFDRDDVRTINEHLKTIYAEAELESEATIRKFRIVRQEGGRQVGRLIEYYNLDAILAVGYRVRSRRGTQFRQWATARFVLVPRLRLGIPSWRLCRP